MARVTLPLITDLTCRSLSDLPTYSSYGKDSYLYNGYVETNKLGEKRVVQRPGLDKQFTSSGSNASGMYYWERNGKLYVIFGTEIVDSNNNSIATLTGNTGYLDFTENGSNLVMVSTTDDKIWSMNTSETITDQTSNLDASVNDIVRGVVNIDGFTTIMESDGTIWHSNLNDVSTWDADAYLNAELEDDKGVAILKHRNHLVALGTSTTEFFFNARNTAGSIYDRREDVTQNIGCSEPNSIYQTGDIAFWLGQNKSGHKFVCLLDNFDIKIVSNTIINKIIQEHTVTNSSIHATGMEINGHVFYCMTLVGGTSYDYSLVYDLNHQIWYVWQGGATSGSSFGGFPILYSSAYLGTYSEPYVLLRDDDTLYQLANGQNTDDNSDTGATSIQFRVQLPEFRGSDNESGLTKFLNSLELDSDYSSVSGETMVVAWIDDDYVTEPLGAGNFDTIDITDYQKITNLGSFKRRALLFIYGHDATTPGSARLKNITLDYDVSTD